MYLIKKDPEIVSKKLKTEYDEIILSFTSEKCQMAICWTILISFLSVKSSMWRLKMNFFNDRFTSLTSVCRVFYFHFIWIKERFNFGQISPISEKRRILKGTGYKFKRFEDDFYSRQEIEEPSLKPGVRRSTLKFYWENRTANKSVPWPLIEAASIARFGK